MDKIVDNLPHYGATYLLMTVGAVAVVVLIARGSAGQRLYGLAVGGELAVTVYNLTIGGLVEQQNFYQYVVSATVAVAVVGSWLLVSRSRMVAGIAVAGLLAILVLDAGHFVTNRTVADDSYVRLDAFLAANYPKDVNILSTTETWELLSATPLLLRGDISLEDQIASSPLVLTSTTQIYEGYASVGPDIYAQLRAAGALVVWSHSGPSNGTLELWLVPHA